MRIQREAYERIADTIKLCLERCATKEGQLALTGVAVALGNMFKGQAHGFDVPLFLDNCGVKAP